MKKKLDEKVLAEGEVTGHAHRVSVDVFEEDGVRSFQGATEVVHEEHNPISIPPSPTGEWESGIVQEWDIFNGVTREIRD